MNISHLTHTIIALLLQTVFWGVSGNLWIGAAFAAGWFINRELTQAEYRWISEFGKGKRENLPWWGQFDYRVWKTDAVLDALAPTLAVVALAQLGQ